MYKNILVATDGSPIGNRAVIAGASLASALDADLTLVTVVGQGDVSEHMVRTFEVEHLIEERNPEDITMVGSAPVPLVRSSSDASLAAKVHQAMAETIMHNALEEASALVTRNPTNLIAEGDPAEVILDLAARNHHDLIVIGSRGFGELKSLFLGSVSSKVNQLAECPCLIIK